MQINGIGSRLLNIGKGGASVLASRFCSRMGRLVRSLAPPDAICESRSGALRLDSRLSAFTAAFLAVGIASAFAQDTNRLNPPDFSAFKIIIDRNIFDPNRRPLVAAGPAATIVDSFSLVGTMSFAKGRFAVFDGTGPDYHKVIEPGGSIAGFRVKEIGRDTVKLQSSTNDVELAVGMQMRRNEDGRWSVAESPESSGGSYAANPRRRDSSRRRSSSDSNRAGSQPGTAAGEQPQPDQTDTGSGAGAANPPPEAAGGDPNDPVARMMAKRLQETGGNTNGTQSGNPNGNDN